MCPYCYSANIFERLAPSSLELEVLTKKHNAGYEYLVTTCRDCGLDHITMDQLQKNAARRNNEITANFVGSLITS